MRNYFEKSETMCRCGCGFDITPETRDLANKVREAWGGPVVVASGARCRKYNEVVGGATFSAHMSGIALDLRPGTGDMRTFHDFCIERLETWGCRMEAPQATPSWCHLDLRPPTGQSRVFLP